MLMLIAQIIAKAWHLWCFRLNFLSNCWKDDLQKIQYVHEDRYTVKSPTSYLKLSTKALASSKCESGKSAVRQSVMLKKCFSRPINVDWSHRGASMSNELKAMVVVKKRPQLNALKSLNLWTSSVCSAGGYSAAAAEAWRKGGIIIKLVLLNKKIKSSCN